MTLFTEHFWGEKNNGFDILYHNMKHGQDSSKEFGDFLRESCTAEDNYAKYLNKLAANAGKYGSKGSFAPFWQVMKMLAEKLASLHLQLVCTWQELMKDVQRYTEEQHKKHKGIKDSESSTMETVSSIQQTIVTLQKAKENYHARCLEYEKLKRDNASAKDIEKAEVKLKKANDEYRQLVEKYSNVRNDFESKMLESCKKFQEIEEYHLQQMKDFVDTYAKAWESQHALVGQVHEEFRKSSAEHTVESLISTFVTSKCTGTEKPGPIEFEEADLSKLPPPSSTPDAEKKEIPVLEKPKKEGGENGRGTPIDGTTPTTETTTKSSGPSSLLDWNPVRNTSWFLSRRRKDKKKKKKKEEKESEAAETSSKGSPKVDEDGFAIDEEGYRIRPKALDAQGDRDSWYSSSDSDSDGDDRGRKIKVEIKPIQSNGGSTGSGNVDDIMKVISGVRLSPTAARRTPTNEMKKSMSMSDNLTSNSSTKASEDLLNIDLFGSVPPSSSTPTGAAFTLGSPMMGNGSFQATTTSATSTPISSANTSDLLGMSPGDLSIGSSSSAAVPRPPSRNRSQTPTSGLAMLSMAPPPSRTSRSNLPSTAYARPKGRESPALVNNTPHIERTDSVPSLNSTSFSTSMSMMSSRGPSPLTIGMSDVVPLAVAFSETCNAIFRGTDESKVKLMYTGEVMLSFPVGIMRVLTENPSPAELSFRLKNTTRLEKILVNNQLCIEDTSQSSIDSKVYTFTMSSLTDHLRRQAEQNKTASYFNIDILKYQVKASDNSVAPPLQLVSYWKCEKQQTDYRLDYKYNGASMKTPLPLNQVTVIVPIDGDVTHMQSKPTAVWSSEKSRAMWRISDISNLSEDNGRGTLRAKFDLAGGPSKPSATAVQFFCDGTTLSGVDFELASGGYRISLIKKRFITGKYVSETDTDIKYV